MSPVLLVLGGTRTRGRGPVRLQPLAQYQQRHRNAQPAGVGPSALATRRANSNTRLCMMYRVAHTPVSRSKSSPVPEVVAGSGTMQISNIGLMDAISIFIHITHECVDSKKLIMWSHTKSDV